MVKNYFLGSQNSSCSLSALMAAYCNAGTRARKVSDCTIETLPGTKSQGCPRIHVQRNCRPASAGNGSTHRPAEARRWCQACLANLRQRKGASARLNRPRMAGSASPYNDDADRACLFLGFASHIEAEKAADVARSLLLAALGVRIFSGAPNQSENQQFIV